MRRQLAICCVALVAVLAAAGAGAAGPAATPGVSPASIVLGGIAPLSGPYSTLSSVSRGAAAYFEHVNARGGVNGRSIAYEVLDDAHDPAQALEAARALVEQDGVFAVFNAVGTEHNLLLRDYLNAAGVPHLFAASGSTRLGLEAGAYPYSIGFQPSHRAEGWIYGRFLARARPEARVAVLFQDDDDGNELLNGLQRGLRRSRVELVASEPYGASAADIRPQVAALASSGAEVFVVFATGRFAVQAFTTARKLGWRPELAITSAASSASSVMRRASEGGRNPLVEGAVSGAFVKDPTDPRWWKDPAIRLYRSVLARYGKGANAADVSHVVGMAAAYTLIEVLERAGASPTRAGVMRQVRSLRIASNPFLLPGIAIETADRDRFPLQQLQLQRWEGGGWRVFGGLWEHRAG